MKKRKFKIYLTPAENSIVIQSLILVDFRLRDSILLIGMLALFAVIIWTSFQPISF